MVSQLKPSAVVIVVGSILFLIAAFSPISRIFGLPSAESRLQVISASPNTWIFAQALFSIGSLVTGVGILLAAIALHGRPSSPLLYVSAVFLLIGAAAWSWHVYLRASDPRAFTEGTLPAWHFVVYSVLTMAALSLIGIAFLSMGFPAWSAWLLIGGSILLFVLYLIFKDMPPFVYYVMTLTLGVVLFRSG
ncbi:MAG: hypothetical protein KF893_03770 [Caldilineaceae bacterium]|nr:hypothetical protein [Caldilineaceae bacterium]